MNDHVLHLGQTEPVFANDLGSVTYGDSGQLPILDGISLGRVTLAPGAFREPHWTVAATSMGYCVTGRLLVTIFSSGNNHDCFLISAGQMFYVPAGALHTVENVGEDVAEFVVAYSQSKAQGFGLSGSVGAFSRSVVGNTLGLPAEKIPSEFISRARDIWIGAVQGEVEIPREAEYPNQFKYAVEETPAQLQAEGGTAKFARQDAWPILQDLAMYSVRIAGVGMREPHWHPITAEMGYVQTGHARMTVRNPGDDTEDTLILGPGDLYFMPRSFPHHIENLDDTETHFTIFFDRAMPLDIGFTGSLSSVPRRILAPTLGLPENLLPQIPDVPADLMFVDKVNPVDPVPGG